MTVVTLF